MKSRQEKFNFIALWLLFLLIFLITFRNCISLLDVDLGWHLRIGKDLLVNNIWPRFDIYSFSHFGHTWIDHEWFSDLISYFIYSKTNFLFLASLFTLIICLVFYIEYKIIKKFFQTNNLIIILLFILALFSLFGFIGVRMQVISWLGSIIILYLLLKHYYQNNIKILFLIPMLIILWVNLHGGFILGIGLLAVYTIFSPKNKKILLLILLLSLLATLISPYFWEIWKEIWQVGTDSFGKSHIVEWSPLLAYPLNIFELIYLLLFSIFISINRNYRKIPPPFLIILIIILLSALLHKRNMPIFIILSLPFMTMLVQQAIGQKNLNKYLQINFITLGSLFFVNIVMLLSLLGNWNFVTTDPYENPEIYPYKTTQYLENNPLEGNTFVNFAWGGYLLWKMPEGYKMFYDGRMVHWQENNKRFLQEYLDINNPKDNWHKILDKYKIKNIIVEKTSFLAKVGAKDWINRLFYQDKIDQLKQQTNLYKKLLDEQNWKQMYENEEAYIFRKTEESKN